MKGPSCWGKVSPCRLQKTGGGGNSFSPARASRASRSFLCAIYAFIFLAVQFSTGRTTSPFIPFSFSPFPIPPSFFFLLLFSQRLFFLFFRADMSLP